MNKPDKTKHEHHRRSIRLSGYDYSKNGAYLATICTRNRERLFGDIQGGNMILNDVGRIAQQCWHEIPRHYPHVSLGAFVVMPNHIHGIFVIEQPVVGASASRRTPVPKRTPSTNENRAKDFSPLRKPFGTSMTVGAIVRGYKIGVTKWCRTHARTNMVWQRNYYEHIIRNDREWDLIVEYIEKNPELWEGVKL